MDLLAGVWRSTSAGSGSSSANGSKSQELETSQASSGGRWEARLGMNRGLNVLISSSWALVLGCPLGARAAREWKLGEVHISRSWAKAVKWASLAKDS